MSEITTSSTSIRDRLLLSDPCLARLIFASRALLGLVAVAVVGWGLAGMLGQDFSGVMLGVVAAQFTLLLARQPDRSARISSSLVMIPGYWLGLLLIHSFAEVPACQVVILPLMVGLGFWLQNGRSRLATMVMAAAWIFLFTIYFQVQHGSLLWQMLAVGVAVPVMMAVRFLIWSEDRRVNRSLILRSHQLILIRAARRAGRNDHRADVLGELHKSMVTVANALRDHPHIDRVTRETLLDQRRAVEVELLREPARGPDIARILEENPQVQGQQVGCPQIGRAAEERFSGDSLAGEVSYTGSPVVEHPEAAGTRGETKAAESTTIDSKMSSLRPALEERPTYPEAESPEPEAGPRPGPAAVSHKRAIQVVAAVLPAALAGFYISPERWPWAVLVAMFMFFGTESSGRMLSKGVQNVIGVITGVILAIGLSHLLPPVFWLELVVIMVLAFLAFYLIPVNYAAGMTAVTALIGQALALGGDDIAVLLQLRLTEVLAGAAFGLLAGLCIMPERASDNLRNACARLLRDVADLLDPDQPEPDASRLREGLAAVYGAADFGRLAGLLIDGTGMRAALVEMAQLKHLAEVHRRLLTRAETDVSVDDLRTLAERCRTTAELVLNRRQAELEPMPWPEHSGPGAGVLAAMDASIQAIARVA